MFAMLVMLVAIADPLPSAGPRPEVQSEKPDFSTVTSQSQADEMVRQGKLVRVYLFPVEFGGPKDPINSSVMTPEAAAARELILGTMTRYIEQGLLDKMTVDPEYRGASLVPTRIVFHARNSKTGASFEPTIEVW